MINKDELEAQISGGKVKMTSKYNTRNEVSQKKVEIIRYKRITKEPAKACKIIAVKEFAMPFDPNTCEETDTYNRDMKFRPETANTTTQLALKSMYNKDEEKKKLFLEKLGLESWDTSDVEHITDEDKSIFRRFVVPRIFTLHCMKVNSQLVNGNSFVYGRDYSVSIPRNPQTGLIDEDAPIPAIYKFYKFLNEVYYERINALKERLNDKQDPLTEVDFAKQKEELRKEVIISADRPVNSILALELPTTPKKALTLPDKLDRLTIEDISEYLRFVPITGALKIAMEQLTNGEFSPEDPFNDFWEIDMKCPSKGTQQEIGMGTQYTAPFYKLTSMEGYNEFTDTIRDCIDKIENIEQIFMNSAYVTEFPGEKIPTLAAVCKSILSIDDPAITQKVLTNNEEVMRLIYGEDAYDAKLIEAGVMGLPEGTVDSAQADKEGKELDANTIDVSALLGDDVVMTDSEDVAVTNSEELIDGATEKLTDLPQ